jgi:hypothetical protein
MSSSHQEKKFIITIHLRLLVALYSFQNNADHWVTIGNAASIASYTLQGTLGYLSTTQHAGMVPLYGCTVPSTGNHFVSFDGGREGIGVGDSSVTSLPFVLGYVYTSPPAGVTATAIYRCHLPTGSESVFFDSTDTNCEGQPKDGPQGYVLPTADTVYNCSNSTLLLQSNANAIVSRAQGSGIYTAQQISQLMADPCQVLIQQVGDTSTLAGQKYTVLEDGHVCTTFTWTFDHDVFGSPDALFTVSQDICVDPFHQFLDDGTTPPPTQGMTTQEYINTAHRPHAPTVTIGLHPNENGTPQIFTMLSYKLNGVGGNGVLYDDWQVYSNGSLTSPRGAWKVQVGYNAGVLGAGGGGLFGAFASDYQHTLPIISVDNIPTACVVRNNCGSGT